MHRTRLSGNQMSASAGGGGPATALTDHSDEGMRSLNVSLLRVQREARRLEDPEDEHADRRRDEQRPPPDLVAQQPRDDRDDEVEDVEDAVLLVPGLGGYARGRGGWAYDQELSCRIGDYVEK